MRYADRMKTLAGAGLALGLIIQCAWALQPQVRVVGLSIKAGARGTALVVTGSTAFIGEVEASQQAVNGSTSEITLRIADATYGLGVHRFTELPEGSPVAEIEGREREGYGVVELVVRAHILPDEQAVVKAKGNRILLLVSQDPVKAVSWEAPAPLLSQGSAGDEAGDETEWEPAGIDGEARAVALVEYNETVEAAAADEPEPELAEEPEAVAEQEQNTETPVAEAAVEAASDADVSDEDEGGIACLENVNLVQRDGVARLQFVFSHASQARVRREHGRAILLFEGAVNCIGEPRLEPPGEQHFRSVELRQRTRDDGEWLGAIVTLGSDSSPLYVTHEGTTVSVVTSVLETRRYSFWTTDDQPYTAVAFVEPEPVEADAPDEATDPEPYPAANAVPEEDGVVESVALGQVQETAPEPEAVEDEVQDSEGAAVAAAAVVSEPSTPHELDEPETVTGYLVTVGDNINLRGTPSTEENNVLGRLGRGATVGLLGEEGAWCRVKTMNETVGWVYGSLLAERTDVAADDDGEGPELAAEKPTKPVAPVQATASMASMFPVNAVGALTSMAQGTPPAGTTGPASTVASSPSPAPAPDEAPPLPNLVRYNTYGRDPFIPHSRKIDDGYPNVENLRLVGILYDRSDRIALLQDDLFQDKSYTMREQDQVSSGTVWRINPTNVIFLITELGISRTYTLELPNVSPTKVQARRGKS